MRTPRCLRCKVGGLEGWPDPDRSGETWRWLVRSSTPLPFRRPSARCGKGNFGGSWSKGCPAARNSDLSSGVITAEYSAICELLGFPAPGRPASSSEVLSSCSWLLRKISTWPRFRFFDVYWDRLLLCELWYSGMGSANMLAGNNTTHLSTGLLETLKRMSKGILIALRIVHLIPCARTSWCASGIRWMPRNVSWERQLRRHQSSLHVMYSPWETRS